MPTAKLSDVDIGDMLRSGRSWGEIQARGVGRGRISKIAKRLECDTITEVIQEDEDASRSLSIGPRSLVVKTRTAAEWSAVYVQGMAADFLAEISLGGLQLIRDVIGNENDYPMGDRLKALDFGMRFVQWAATATGDGKVQPVDDAVDDDADMSDLIAEFNRAKGA